MHSISESFKIQWYPGSERLKYWAALFTELPSKLHRNLLNFDTDAYRRCCGTLHAMHLWFVLYFSAVHVHTRARAAMRPVAPIDMPGEAGHSHDRAAFYGPWNSLSHSMVIYHLPLAPVPLLQGLLSYAPVTRSATVWFFIICFIHINYDLGKYLQWLDTCRRGPINLDRWFADSAADAERFDWSKM